MQCHVGSSQWSLGYLCSILAVDKSLRIFNITKMAGKRSQRAMLNGQYRALNSYCSDFDTGGTPI